MISLDDLRAFVAVAKHESFASAADELLITPPALSRRIKKLEDFVGDPLFERTTQMVGITPSGQALLERAAIVVRDFDSFKDFASRFASNHTAQIRFACIWSTAGSVVPGLIRDYTRLHEQAEFDVQDANAETVARLISERQVDFGISMRPSDEEDLDFHLLCEDPIILACPPGHPLYDNRSVTWSRLIKPNLPKIDWGVIRSIHVGAFKQRLDAVNVPYARGAAIYHLSTQLGFLESHLRAMVLPLLGATLSRAPDIRCIPIVRPVLKREIGIVTQAKASLPRGVHSFLEHIETRFRDHYRSAIDRLDAPSINPDKQVGPS